MAAYNCIKFECNDCVQIIEFGLELWGNLVLYCAVSHCRCHGLLATLNGRQQSWIVIGWPEAPLLGGCGVAAVGHGHSRKQTIYPLLRGATEKSWKKSPEERPQRPSPYSTTLTHAMLVHCQIEAQGHNTLLHQYLLFGDSFAIQRGQEHSSEPW